MAVTLSGSVVMNLAKTLRGIVLVAVVVPHGIAGAQANTGPLTRAEFEAMLARVDNSSRWGPQDERGTLNFITPRVRRAAASEVREGTSISLARDLIAGSEGGFLPTTVDFMHVPDSVLGPADNSVMWAGEKLGLFYHGWAHTHVDALSHLTYRGRGYNRRAVTRREGAPDHGRIDLMRDGLMSRGVLVDVPRLRAAQGASSKAPLSVDDLAAWERPKGIRIRSGDIVIIRSGRWESANPPARSTGVHPSVAEWLRERNVAAFGDEGGTDMSPSPVTGINSPFHVLAIVGMGMPLIENLDLEALASEAARRSRWTFLFVAAPLRIQSGTGSPLNPLAVF
jgi:kynurenine formamidase